MNARQRIDSGEWEEGVTATFEFNKALALLEALYEQGISIVHEGAGSEIDAVAAGMAARLLEKGFVPRWVKDRYMVMHRSSLTPLYVSFDRVAVYDQTGRKLEPGGCDWRCATILMDIAYGQGSIDVIPAHWDYLLRGYNSK